MAPSFQSLDLIECEMLKVRAGSIRQYVQSTVRLRTEYTSKYGTVWKLFLLAPTVVRCSLNVTFLVSYVADDCSKSKYK